MKLGLFTMPFHPAVKKTSLLLRENFETIQYAESLGFSEAYIGEHATDEYEKITSSLCFVSSLIYGTSKIKLATGTVNLPNHHPAYVAAAASMIDHMSEGRLILGVSLGALATDWELYGSLNKDRAAMFEEAINHILKIWKSPDKIDLKGDYWNISTSHTSSLELGTGKIYAPFQKPYPEIVCSALVPNSPGLKKAGQKGFAPLSSNFLDVNGLTSHWKMYEEGAKLSKKPDENRWRVARLIFVCPDKQKTIDYVNGPHSPYRECAKHIIKKLASANKIEELGLGDKSACVDTITEKYLNSLVISGDPSEVTEKLIELREKVGNFGTLLYVKVDNKDEFLANQSLRLLSEKVFPNVN